MGGDTRMPTRTSYPRFAGKPVGKQIHNIYVDRLREFLDTGQYADKSLMSKLYHGSAAGEPHVRLSVWSAPGLTRPTFEEATLPGNKYHPTDVGASFGPSWSTHWFRIRLTVPDFLRKCEGLEFHWDASNEGMVWTADGVPLQGLTGGGERPIWRLPDTFRDGEEHTFYIEMACNRIFGNSPTGDANQPPAKDTYFMLQQAQIWSVNLEARQLWFDFWIISDAAREFPDNSWEEHEALQVCNRIMDHFIARDGSWDCIPECREIAQEYIGDKINTGKIYDDHPDAMITGIGHCHIDTCWLWPWAETKRKIARSWLNQCDLLDRYPEHRFCASQAQQYKWLQTYYPSAFDRVKDHVKKRNFHPIGGSWVEHDTNMPSGESLVRQFVYGQRFFQSRFGERSTTFWLPDTFGYSSQLPQLSRLAGMSRFFTQKLSWNNINNFPHTTFNWVALDGSQVLCHMTPCETYTADANFGDVVRSVTQHKSMDQDPSSLLVFGKGDGGGGPTWEQLERLRRCRGVSDTVGKLARVRMGDSVDDFFAKLERRAAGGTEFATWFGELYFELHRGTYTTQANNKKNNRKAEIMMHDIEYLVTYASFMDDAMGSSTSYKYPKADIDEMWEDILLCQFHDCLPGSSIEMCYDDTDKTYSKVFTRGEKLLKDAMSALGFTKPTSDHRQDQSMIAINTLHTPRVETIKLPSNLSPSASTATTYALVKPLEPNIPGLSSVTPLSTSTTSAKPVTMTQPTAGVYILGNDDVNITVTHGVITSLYDNHAKRELVPPGSKANQFVLYDDKPLYWQAWDVEVYHLASRKELHPYKVTPVEHGPARVALEICTRISDKSHVKTRMSLSSHPVSMAPTTRPARNLSPYPSLPATLEFTSHISWHENKSFLKVEFPTALHAPTATYETQFGTVARPTHYNTSWDMAKFEVCSHRFADLSEANYGLAVFNDCKYGFAVQGNVMRLSLVRAPKAPDGNADMGDHVVRYGVAGHQGPLDARVVRRAREFNNPVVAAGDPADGKADEALGTTRADQSDCSIFPYTSLPNGYLAAHPSALKINALLSSIRVCPVCSDAGITLDTLKRSDDDYEGMWRREDEPLLFVEGDGEGEGLGKSVIVRLYEALGGRSKGRVLLGGMPVRKVKRVNLLEDEVGDVEVDGVGRGLQWGDGVMKQEEGKERGFDVELRAFEVANFKVYL